MPSRRSRVTRSGSSSTATGSPARNAADAPRADDPAVLGGRPPGRLLGGEDAVGDADPAVPQPGADQVLGHDRGRLPAPRRRTGWPRRSAHSPGRIGVTPAAISSTADSTTSKVRISLLGCRSSTDQLGAAGRGVPTAHPPAYALHPGRGRAGVDLAVLDHGERQLRVQPELSRRRHHRPVRHHTTITRVVVATSDAREPCDGHRSAGLDRRQWTPRSTSVTLWSRRRQPEGHRRGGPALVTVTSTCRPSGVRALGPARTRSSR